MIDLAKQKAVEFARWQACVPIANLIPTLDSVAKRLVANKGRYVNVENIAGVPWAIIAVIHERESSQSWTAQLSQGDPLNKPSIHIPRNRGPFKSWEDGAVDALMHCAPFLSKWEDWSIGGALCSLDGYNGEGYWNMGLPSPYIWSSTNQYTHGKYIADGHFDPNAVDHQLGCAGLLLRMIVQDPSISGGWHP